MKILYITSTLRRTGPTSQLYNIVNHVSKYCEVVIVTLSPEPDDSLLNKFSNLNVKLIQLNLSRLSGVFFSRKEIKKLIKKEDPSIIHTQGVRADNLASNFSSAIPCISTVRNFPQLDLPMTYGKLKGKLLEFIQVRALKKLSRVCGVSDSVALNLERHYKLRNVSCVRNGVDTEQFMAASNEEKIELRRSLSLPKSSYQFISSGHLSARKNPLMLIRSFIQAFSDDQNVSLIFIGAGNLDVECRHLAKGYNIHFVGRVTNVSDYLASSDCFVSASLAEGMPNAVLEAMAMHLSVVLSDISPHKEIFDVDSGVGHLFSLDSDEQLVTILRNMIREPSGAYKASLQRVINTEFSAQAMASKYLNLYQIMIKEKESD